MSPDFLIAAIGSAAMMLIAMFTRMPGLALAAAATAIMALTFGWMGF